MKNSISNSNKPLIKWWGYIHQSGTVQAKPQREDLDQCLKEAEESPFVRKVYSGITAETRDQALVKIANKWKSMYFKCDKKSEMGVKIKTHFDKIRKVHNQATELINELGATDGTLLSHMAAGPPHAFMFEEEPDQKVWKKEKRVEGRQTWSPRLSTKEGKALAKKIEKIPDVPKHELLEIIGAKNYWVTNHPGFKDGKNVYGIHVSPRWFEQVTISEDLVEITYGEYEKIEEDEE